MNRPRPVAYRSLAVHRPAPSDSRPARAGASASGFQQALRKGRGAGRGGHPDQPAPLAGDAGADATADVPERIEPPTSGGSGEDEGEGGGRDDASDDPAAEDWASALVPTCDSLDPLLAAVPRAGRAGRAGLPDAIEAVARTIAGFCNEGAVSDSEGWSVRIPLRPDVFPDTTLELGIATYWLQLRFEVGHAPSRELLREHLDALGQRLSESLVRQREIAITID